jgi:hypothetical protein
MILHPRPKMAGFHAFRHIPGPSACRTVPQQEQELGRWALVTDVRLASIHPYLHRLEPSLSHIEPSIIHDPINAWPKNHAHAPRAPKRTLL